MIKKIFNYFDSIKLEKVILIDIIFFFFTATLFFNFFLPQIEPKIFTENGAEFTQLAQSFLDGRLDLQKAGDLDCSRQAGKCYWALGPAPAVLLLPFVFLAGLFGQFFFQGYLNFFLVIFVFLICWFLAKKFGYGKFNSLWLAFAFCFSSVFLGSVLNENSWYFSHTVNTFFLLLAFWEFFNRKRYWLIGIFLAFVFCTRLNSGLSVIFFIFEIFFDKSSSIKTKFKSFILLLGPIFCALILLSGYNFFRFGNFLDTGYNRAENGLAIQQYLKENYGLFNVKYFFTNFYYSFLKLPEAVLNFGYMIKAPYFVVSPFGLSFFLVSPIFLKIFTTKFFDLRIMFLWLTSILILLSVLFYFNCGYFQFGPRYLIDLLPLLFILLLFSFKGREFYWKTKILILLSGFLNFYFYLNLFINS